MSQAIKYLLATAKFFFGSEQYLQTQHLHASLFAPYCGRQASERKSQNSQVLLATEAELRCYRKIFGCYSNNRATTLCGNRHCGTTVCAMSSSCGIRSLFETLESVHWYRGKIERIWYKTWPVKNDLYMTCQKWDAKCEKRPMYPPLSTVEQILSTKDLRSYGQVIWDSWISVTSRQNWTNMSAICLPAVILCLTLAWPIKWLLKPYFVLKLEFKHRSLGRKSEACKTWISGDVAGLILQNRKWRKLHQFSRRPASWLVDLKRSDHLEWEHKLQLHACLTGNKSNLAAHDVHYFSTWLDKMLDVWYHGSFGNSVYLTCNALNMLPKNGKPEPLYQRGTGKHVSM